MVIMVQITGAQDYRVRFTEQYNKIKAVVLECGRSSLSHFIETWIGEVTGSRSMYFHRSVFAFYLQLEAYSKD